MCYLFLTALHPEASTRHCLNNVIIAYQLGFPDRGNTSLRRFR